MAAGPPAIEVAGENVEGLLRRRVTVMDFRTASIVFSAMAVISPPSSWSRSVS
jgi:hypothetical protein